MRNKIDCNKIVPGVRFSAPVFFDDGQNMFLAANKPAKNYHVAALKRWKVPYLLTDGHQLESFKTARSLGHSFYENGIISSTPASPEDFGELEDLGELEEL
ncbi:MAG: phosphohydrolase [Treponema sp.]|nr:phosphohydrolase [Spirochaetia bacterium]MDD7014882.1 phosphohydrolase [Spirochaetales bacterium]MDY4901725.1 phosphohydrolase [Treponema sp.]